MAERRSADFYPTAPCAMQALSTWWRGAKSSLADTGDHWLDPAAGSGSALAWFGVPYMQRHAIELRGDPYTRTTLARYVPPAATRLGVSALDVAWPAVNVFANPPFNLLDAFVARIINHAQTTGKQCIILTPTQWWQAQSRRKLPRPQFFLPLNWRVPFMGKGSAQFDTAFSVFAPVPGRQNVTQTQWLDRPNLPRTGPHRAAVWDEFDSIQPPAWLLDMYSETDI